MIHGLLNIRVNSHYAQLKIRNAKHGSFLLRHRVLQLVFADAVGDLIRVFRLGQCDRVIDDVRVAMIAFPYRSTSMQV